MTLKSKEFLINFMSFFSKRNKINNFLTLNNSNYLILIDENCDRTYQKNYVFKNCTFKLNFINFNNLRNQKLLKIIIIIIIFVCLKFNSKIYFSVKIII